MAGGSVNGPTRGRADQRPARGVRFDQPEPPIEIRGTYDRSLLAAPVRIAGDFHRWSGP
jgi:hypothetical protein